MTLEGEWEVVLMDTEGELRPLRAGTSIRFEVNDQNRIAGKALNRFMGRLDTDASKPFGPLATTMMAGPPEIMDQEQLFLSLLGAVDGIAADRVNLTIGDRVVMVLSRGGTEEE